MNVGYNVPKIKIYFSKLFLTWLTTGYRSLLIGTAIFFIGSNVAPGSILFSTKPFEHDISKYPEYEKNQEDGNTQKQYDALCQELETFLSEKFNQLNISEILTINQNFLKFTSQRLDAVKKRTLNFFDNLFS